jgi:hypothetical protein
MDVKTTVQVSMIALSLAVMYVLIFAIEAAKWNVV